MENDLYGDIMAEGKDQVRANITKRKDLRVLYHDFLKDFRQYLIEFMKESMHELVIAEIPIGDKPISLFEDDHLGRFVTMKNQGLIECFVSTGKKGGYRLDPGEVRKIWANSSVSIMTISGNTSLGIIQN